MPNGHKILNNFFSNNKFLGSYDDVKMMPYSNFSEFCFVGRSNVGKSSILNAITKTKNLAKTSKTPGRTQLINLFEISKLKAKIHQIRNEVIYNDETSSLNPISSIIPFLYFHLKKFFSFKAS